jgi:hypothetical protein
MATQRLVCHTTFFKTRFNSLPEAVKYEVGAFLEAVSWNPHDPEWTGLARTRLNSKCQCETLLLPSAYRILWTLTAFQPGEECIQVFDVIEPDAG